MSAAAWIIHLDRIVQTVALYDPSVCRFPSAAATAAGPRRLRPDFLRVWEAGQPVARRKRSP